ncbi:MAG: hypothetical protein COB76_03215 [Alphaproteobacteria bacterium]|nr:MAG: hypothetical protein COB76_03215 [Alphaproteobacteria bacterium]
MIIHITLWFYVRMQGIQALKQSFNESSLIAANLNEKPYIKIRHKQQILAAYGLGSQNNNWVDYTASFEDNYFSLETFRKNGSSHRMIVAFKHSHEDNDGFKFSVYTFGRERYFQTNNLRNALGNFKSAPPQLRLVP